TSASPPTIRRRGQRAPQAARQCRRALSRPPDRSRRAGRPGRVVGSGETAPARRPRRASTGVDGGYTRRSEEHTSELQSRFDLVCRLLLEKKKYESWNE